MNISETEKQKIKGFAADEIMFEAVKKVLRDIFIKDKGNREVQTLAGERLAQIALEEGFKELKKYSIQTQITGKEINNVGL